MTDKYAHKDWVAPRQRKDDHGNKIGRPYLVDVLEGIEGALHCEKRIRLSVSWNSDAAGRTFLDLLKGVPVNCGRRVHVWLGNSICLECYDAGCI